MAEEMRQISIYGKGGVGKSTVACNLSVALAEVGYKPMQVGCSPKADSTYLLLGELCYPTILEQMRTKGPGPREIEECIKTGYKDIVCAEAGGPEPAAGCAGRGVMVALSMLKKYEVPQRHGVDVMLYDVIADVVCGGFSQPMRKGFAKEIYIVLNGELMALYAANNICGAIEIMSKERGVEIGVGGLINNMRGIPRENELVEEFSGIINVPILTTIPRSDLIPRAEARKGTVMQHFPESDEAGMFRELAKQVLEAKPVAPKPMGVVESIETISELIRKYMVPA